MRYLWGLTHLMQLLRVIVLVNLIVPSSVTSLLNYYKLANADLELVSSFIPKLISKYVINVSQLKNN